MKKEVRTDRKRNWNKILNMGSLGALGFVLLFHYQNCAPAPGGLRSVASEEDGIVTTIDDVNLTTGLAFVQPKVQLTTTDEPTLIEGVCSRQQNGSVLRWKLRDSKGSSQGEGYAVCDEGQFMVELAPARELNCDESYDVTAQLGQGSSSTEVKRDCLAE